MPEGPSIVILKEQILKFKGKIVQSARGNAAINISSLKSKKILDIRSWGKQFFLLTNDFTVRIHLLMFGSYSLDEQTKPDRSLRLQLDFRNGKVFFYTCSVKMLGPDIYALYDWEADVLSDSWKPLKARKKLKMIPETMVCDALLDQQIFAGSGNIIKNEVLYRIRLHPETKLGAIPSSKLTQLIREVRQYSFDFLDWKRNFMLRKHWLAYSRKICTRCNLPFTKKQCGSTKRRTFFCTNCQVLYPAQ